jgi:hypothetical protein
MGKGNGNPRRDWGVEGWPSKPSKSVRTPRSGHSFIGPAVGIMSIPLVALLVLAGYFAHHFVS